MTEQEVPFDRIPPQNLEMEQCVLGAMLIEREAIETAVEILSGADFYRDAHRIIFEAITALHAKSIEADILSVSEQLQQQDILENAGGAPYLIQLTNAIPSAANVAHYAKVVKEKSICRGLIGAAREIDDAARGEYGQIAEITDRAERAVQSVTDSAAGANREGARLHHSGELTAEVFADMERAALHPSRITGFTTGFDELDFVTAGLQRGELILLGARTSVGKSALAGQMALHIGKNFGVVAFFAFEMPKREVMRRMLSIEAKVDLHAIRCGLLQPEERKRLLDARADIDESGLFLEDSTDLTTTTLRSRLRRFARTKNLSLVVIDHIGIMPSGEKQSSRYLELGIISRDLLRIAKEFDVPVLALAQVHRNADGRRPQLADLRESGNLEQDARTVLFIHRPKFNDNPDMAPLREEPAEIYVAKNNNGPRNIAVPVKFLPHFAAFVPDEKDFYETQNPLPYKDDGPEVARPILPNGVTSEALVGSFMGLDGDPFADE